MNPVVVVGDALLDVDVEGTVERVCPDAPVPVLDEERRSARAGGAGLAAVLAARDGRPVTLITALGGDAAGAEVQRLLAAAGVDVVDLGCSGPTCEKIRLRCSGQSLLRLDRGGAPAAVGSAGDRARAALNGAAAILVADYGRGVAAETTLRALLSRSSRPVVWDPHPKGESPAAGTLLATPNRSELERAAPGDDDIVQRAERLRRRWEVRFLAATLGASGAVLVGGPAPLVVPARRVTGGDTCGAGDRFASAAAGLLADGAVPSEAVAGAVEAATRFVADGGAATIHLDGRPRGRRDHRADAIALARRARQLGDVVVATGGCFDLLHAGHVQLLESARALGDHLVVCLNSDDSVRRLKGPGRPLVPAADRAAVLLGLGCVDAVAVFDEDTPVRLLGELRPHVFAKGGDYAGARIPEEEALAGWGGRVAILPYLDGRSTSGLLEEATRRRG